MIQKFIRTEPWPDRALLLPRIQSHRGFWLEGVQENTLAAFRAAREKGALMFECDVQLSKDKVPIVFHDVDLRRLRQREERVQDLTAKELKELADAPSLWEVLTDRALPRFVNIELKSKRKLDDPLERKVAEVVEKAKAQNRIMFSSFNPMSIYRVSLYLPEVPRALLVTEDDDSDNNILLKKMWLAPLLRLHCLNLHYKMVTPERMAQWRKAKIPVAVWTVNGQAEIQKYLEMGAVSVITDTL